jgi:hypothetical protein
MAPNEGPSITVASQGTEVSRSTNDEPLTPSFPRQNPAGMIPITHVDKEKQNVSRKRDKTYKNELVTAEKRVKAKESKKHLTFSKKTKVEKE